MKQASFEILWIPLMVIQKKIYMCCDDTHRYTIIIKFICQYALFFYHNQSRLLHHYVDR